MDMSISDRYPPALSVSRYNDADSFHGKTTKSPDSINTDGNQLMLQ